jgi:hypothetical protein
MAASRHIFVRIGPIKKISVRILSKGLANSLDGAPLAGSVARF